MTKQEKRELISVVVVTSIFVFIGLALMIAAIAYQAGYDEGLKHGLVSSAAMEMLQ